MPSSTRQVPSSLAPSGPSVAGSNQTRLNQLWLRPRVVMSRRKPCTWRMWSDGGCIWATSVITYASNDYLNGICSELYSSLIEYIHTRSPILVGHMPRSKIHIVSAVSNIHDLYLAGKTKKAKAAQIELAKMEWGFAKGGISDTKWVAAKLYIYPLESCHCEKPYPQYSDAKKQAWMLDVVAPLG